MTELKARQSELKKDLGKLQTDFANIINLAKSVCNLPKSFLTHSALLLAQSHQCEEIEYLHYCLSVYRVNA